MWDIWRREDKPELEKILRRWAYKYTDKEDFEHPIHDQCFYLTSEDKLELREKYGIESYAIKQDVNDAVYIPANCAHQVRNLQGCIKIAADFVSPEHLEDCLSLSEEFSYPNGCGDRLQIRSMIICSFCKTLKAYKARMDE